jgi:hypothetical protein
VIERPQLNRPVSAAEREVIATALTVAATSSDHRTLVEQLELSDGFVNVEPDRENDAIRRGALDVRDELSEDLFGSDVHLARRLTGSSACQGLAVLDGLPAASDSR